MAKKRKADRTIAKLLGDRGARVEAASKSHFLFFHIYFHRYVTYETADFQREIFALTEDDKIPLCVVVAFRESGKSSIITTSYPLWAILGKQQKKFVLVLSQTQMKAQQCLRNIRWELESNEILREDMGPFQEESGPWGAQGLVFRNSGAKIAIGSLDQSIRGIRHREFRPDLIILDDVEDTASVKTQAGRNKTWEWFTSEILPSGKKARIFAVGNLLHHDSLLKRIEVYIKSCRTTGVYKEYPIIKNRVPLLLGKFPTIGDVDAERQRIMDRVAWHREFLLEIVPDDDQVVLPSWIHYYDDLPDESPREIIMAIDPAISTEEGRDYTAMVAAHVYGYDDDTRVYVLANMVNERLTFHQQITRAQEMSEIIGDGDRATIYVEDVAYQKALIQELERNGSSVEGVSVAGTDKRARLMSTTHLFETGRVFFPRTDTAELLVNQLLGFGTESHDDLVDALTLLLHQVMREPSQLPMASFDFRGKYDGQFDHLPPKQREIMMNARQGMRDMFLI